MVNIGVIGIDLRYYQVRKSGAHINEMLNWIRIINNFWSASN